MNKIIVLIMFLLITGCSVTNKSTLVSPVSVEAKSKLQGNIEVGDKISGSIKATMFLGVFQLSGPKTYLDGLNGAFPAYNPFDCLSRLKAAAAYKAIVNSESEIIVNPQYTITIHRALGFSNIEIEVTGYKGVFTEFVNRPID
jgi:hypothetical protein|tara:strand:+ start:95 stop:523 length:429 start_codon:yes stop_codon:yes gene_type:complete